MSIKPKRYYVGDLCAGESALGFLLINRKANGSDPVIDDKTARAIVAGAGGEPNAALGRTNLMEVSEDEFQLYRGPEMSIPGLPDGLTVCQVKG